MSKESKQQSQSFVPSNQLYPGSAGTDQSYSCSSISEIKVSVQSSSIFSSAYRQAKQPILYREIPNQSIHPSHDSLFQYEYLLLLDQQSKNHQKSELSEQEIIENKSKMNSLAISTSKATKEQLIYKVECLEQFLINRSKEMAKQKQTIDQLNLIIQEKQAVIAKVQEENEKLKNNAKSKGYQKLLTSQKGFQQPAQSSALHKLILDQRINQKTYLLKAIEQNLKKTIVESQLVYNQLEFQPVLTNYLSDMPSQPFLINLETQQNYLLTIFSEGKCEKDQFNKKAFIFSLTNQITILPNQNTKAITSTFSDTDHLIFGNNQIFIPVYSKKAKIIKFDFGDNKYFSKGFDGRFTGNNENKANIKRVELHMLKFQ